MTSTKIDWNPTCNRFVAFLDIMGFKDMVFRKKHEDIKKMLELLRPAIQHIENSMQHGLIKRMKRSPGKNDIISFPSAVLPVTFSDSFILFSSDESDISALFMFNYVNLILYMAIRKGIPMKGAIAFGKMTADTDNSYYFGKPLIYAFELQKELQLYGVVLHHTCEKQLSDLNIIKDYEDKNNIFKYKVPMKSGNIIHYLINWTHQLEKEKNPINLVSNLYTTVSGSPRIYVDNTLEFVREVLKRKQENKY